MPLKEVLKKFFIRLIITLIVFYLAKYAENYIYNNPQANPNGAPVDSFLFGALSAACKLYFIILICQILSKFNKWVQLLLLIIIYVITSILSLPSEVDGILKAPSIYSYIIKLVCWLYLVIWIMRSFKKPHTPALVSTTPTPQPLNTTTLQTTEAAVGAFSSIAILFGVVAGAALLLILFVLFSIGRGSY